MTPAISRLLAAALRTAARLRGSEGQWDLTDVTRMAQLRARLAGLVILIGIGPAVRGALIGPAGAGAPAVRTALLLLSPMPVVAVLLLRRGRRIGELAYGLCLATVVVAVACARIRTEAVGSAASQDIVFLIPLILGAVFFEHRRTVVVQVLVSIGASWVDTWHRLSGDPALAQVLIANACTFASLTVVIRLLRDVAYRSVARAEIGEVTDPLSGLLNRRGFERSGGRTWHERAQAHLPLVLLMIDVDHFKQINDTVGHAGGDELLCRLGQLLTSTLRDGDQAFRLGGEEFAILASCHPGGAWVIGERVRELIERELPVTVSIGVVEVQPSIEDQAVPVLWETVGRADIALYAAKAAGRNTVRLVAPASR